MKNITIILIPALVVLYIFFYENSNSWSSEKTAHYQLSQFISPETCGGCHEQIYEQWQGSMHKLAYDDVIYNSVANAGLVGLTDKDEIEEAEHCQTCHTPVGYITGYPLKTSDDKTKIAEIAKQGVQCDYCHSITGAYSVYNAKFKYAPGNGEDDPGVKRGPFKDSESDYHQSEFSDFHTKSELCGTCHDVQHVTFKTWLETTYQEWKNSTYSKQGVQCQDCHMYQRPGYPSTGSTDRPKNPGTAAEGSVEREHIFTHYFVGANMAIPIKEQNTALAQMAEERLKNAVDIKIEPKAEMDKSGKGSKIIIKIINNGAGHQIPTGLTNIRQVWLNVTVTDSKGAVIYKSGVPDAKGYLPENTIIYSTIFGDGKGNPVDNLAKAREIISDKRLEPMKEHVENIDIGNFDGSVTVKASLLYSGLSQKVADSMKELKGMNIPVVVMKEVKAVVTK
ncbi:MAG: cytochrome c554 family protein [Desulfamplus sp.]|nr:cytochrome c554 family protein [Desulfamplus sp.]MBF0412292.1 cytochrome c554 family protein [Desulfamplus sp.]